MAQLIVSAAGAAVGFAIGGPVGAQVGWALGSAVGASLGPKQKVGGSPSTELAPPALVYGSPVPRVYGRVVVTGALVWASDYRPIATTVEQGKGGGGVESTTYSYRSDQLWMLAAESQVLAITRVWDNGELVYCTLADADAATLAASATTDRWDEIELFDGNATQLPWAVYETAVGSANALAYRDRTTVGITNLNHFGSPSPRVLKFEIITAGTVDGPDVPGYLLHFDDAANPSTFVDEAGNTWSYASGGASQLSISTVHSRFGGAALASRHSSSTVGQISTVLAAPQVLPSTNAHSIEGWVRPAGFVSNQSTYIGSISTTVAAHSFAVWFSPYFGLRYQLNVGSSVFIDVAAPEPEAWSHIAGTYDGTTARLFVNGVLVGSAAVAPGAAQTVTGFTLGELTGSDWGGYDYVDECRGILGSAVYTAAFDVPTAPLTIGAALDVWTPAAVDLQDVVEAEIALPGFDMTRLDATDLAGIEVTGYVASGSPRQTLEPLQACHYFDWTCSDKLYARLRGGAVAATIDRGLLAAGVNEATEDIFDPVRGNDEEVPARIALSYVNINADHEPGTEMGDRLVTVGGSTQAVSLPLVLTPQQAKGRALAMALDARNAATTATITLSDDHAAIECTDVLAIPDSGGTTYRMRVVRETNADFVHTLDLVLDDPAALITAGIASDERTPSISVPLPVDTSMVLLDAPIMRDADNEPGLYVAATAAAAGSWPGAVVLRSVDDLAFDAVATVTERAVIGATTTTLAAPAALWVWDDVSTVTVNVGAGTLSSSTKAAMQADRTINVAAIGAHGRWEIVRFVTATLITAGVYTLSGLVRGARGSEAHVGSHTSADSFVLIRSSGIRRVSGEVHELGLPYYWRGVTSNRSRDTASSQTFTNSGVGLLPFAPTRLQASRDGSNNATITWMRRTRLAVRYGGTGGSVVPLGEASESYEIDVYSDDTYTTVLRTITASSETAAYSAANQTTDGLTPGDPISVRVFQLSATVGRGPALEGTV